MTTLPSNLAINAQRLWGTIMETAKFGATPKGGVRRLTLSDEDRQVRDWFRAACKAAGCTVTVDEMGNIFAVRPGRDNALPPVAMGSHLDTQPSGGKFDGIVGVLSGLEVLRTLNDLHIETAGPVALIDWTNEEGSRFGPPMLCSGVFAGVFDRAYADDRRDREGKRFGDELERIGYRGEEKCGTRKLGAHFEMHIEQGPILEAEGKTVGIVTGVQGMRWYDVTLTGNEGHAGSTPMPMRRDALLGAARMIEAVNAAALRHQPTVSTVGLLECKPNSTNVIPGHVFFTVDIRNPSDEVLAVVEAEIERDLKAIAAASDLEIEFKQIWNSPAVHYDPQCIESVRRGVAARGYPAREIVSGPGHDSVYISRVAPTAMIFIPCEKGLSHNEMEKTEPEQVEAGANVLLRAVLDTDQRLAEQSRVR